MAEIGLRSMLKSMAVGIPVTVDVIEVPPQAPIGIVFVVYEDEVMPMAKLDRQVLMARLEKLRQTVLEYGLKSEIIGRPGLPNAL